MLRAVFLMLAAALLVAGCGFHLRGAAELPFKSIYIDAPPASVFATQLRRVINASSDTRIVENPKEAEVVLQLLDERREKEILSLSGAGRVSEYLLRYRVTFRVLDKKQREVVPTSQISLRREVTYNVEQALAESAEEELLYRDMQNDAVQQILRRLQATHLAQH